MGYLELDTTIGKDIKAMAKEVAQFAQSRVRPAGIEMDQQGDPAAVYAEDSVLWDIFKAYRSLDLHTLRVPEQAGGMAGEMASTASPILLEELGAGDAGLTLSLSASNLPFELAALSSDPQHQQLARAYCNDADAAMIGCWAVPNADPYLNRLPAHSGTDQDTPRQGTIKAEIKGDDCILNGETAPAANAPFATHAAILTGPAPDAGNKECAMAVVSLDLPGIHIGDPDDRMGLRPLPQSRLTFTDVVIPKPHMVFKDTAASGTIMLRMHEIIAAACVGLARAAYEEALGYAKTRVQGGVPIIAHKNVKLKLFNMFMNVETSRACIRQVSAHNRAATFMSIPHNLAAKVLATRAAFDTASDAIAIFGGNGLTREYPVEKMFRDARSAMLSSGENNALAISGAAALIRQ